MSYKQYKAIFFDWDGTAVESRTAPAGAILPHMKQLLKNGVKLIIVSGTTYENILGGMLHEYFTAEELQNLFLGLARGVHNYGFDKNGSPIMLFTPRLDIDQVLKIHRVAFITHEILLKEYRIESDIVFSRPAYCKLDFMVGNNRGDKLFLQADEIDKADEFLRKKGICGGVGRLIELANTTGREQDVDITTTSDMKYLEIGIATKSNNVDYFVEKVINSNSISLEDCCFWGDEFAQLSDGVLGSDAQMITELSEGADFYDVSLSNAPLPECVKKVGGGIKSFEEFLREQADY